MEVPVAHVLSFENSYNGIQLLGDTFTTIVDETGVVYGNFKWHQVTEAVLEPQSVETAVEVVDFQTALAKVQNYNQAASLADNQSVGEEIARAELMFVPSEEDGVYTPAWVFDMEDSQRVFVDCLTGSLTEA